MEDTIMGRVVRSVIELIRGADADRFSLASISMNAIADRMGVPKPFLYKHFSNKDGLMAFVWEAMFEPRKKIITEVVNGGAAVPEKLMGLAATGMNKSEEMNRMLFASGDREEMPLLYMAICDSERFFQRGIACGHGERYTRRFVPRNDGERDCRLFRWINRGVRRL